VKITKKRIKDKWVGRKIECIHCDTKQRITARDKFDLVSDRDGSARVYKCGECGKDIWIDVTQKWVETKGAGE
jgi:DNA-directed RNA polymerase subunit RPC12/RpoP